MSEPTVSVIVPVYNAERTIKECVLSILSNFKSLELLLINDGSSDSSGLICDQLAATDMRIRVLHKENGGVGSARNAGISLATGKYLSFIDSDDKVSPDMYETMVQKAEKHNADCVVCNVINLFSTHQKQENHIFGNQVITGAEQVFEKIVVPLITPEHHDAALMQSASNKIYRRSVVKKLGLQFSHLPYAEDWLFNIEFLMNVEAVAFVKDYFYLYDRTTEGSLSKSWRKDSFQNTVWIQNKLAQLFPERYPDESLKLGVLEIQTECMRNYAYYRGVKGFFSYASVLFADRDLVDVYHKISRCPFRYRFAQKCIRNGWKKRYCIWGLYQVKLTVLKHYLRAIVK